MDNGIWWLIVGVSFTPLAVAIYAVWKCSREEELRAELRKTASDTYRLLVINQGPMEARNVAVNLDGRPIQEHTSFVPGERLSSVIRPKFKTSCVLSIPTGAASLGIEITWNNGDDPEVRSYKSSLKPGRRDKRAIRTTNS